MEFHADGITLKRIVFHGPVSKENPLRESIFEEVFGRPFRR